MKLVIAFLAPILVISAAAQTAKKKAPAKAPAAKAVAAPKPIEIPRGAVEIAANTFSYTDPAGKKWIYTKSPFGVMRREDTAAVAPQTSTEPDLREVKAFDAGDSVRFEQPSPFGPVKWERKKTELTAGERALWERQQASAGQQD